MFTFGSGKQGQLGHGVLKDEIVPRPVARFEGKIGNRAAQVSASSVLTSLVTDSGKLYLWGPSSPNAFLSSASRLVRRALLTPLVIPGSLYRHGGKST